VNVTLTPTPTTTGWLEVTVNGELVHSKKAGDGLVSEEKLADILATVEAAQTPK
jgi:selT/selW/selH-like putative selenoprotein